MKTTSRFHTQSRGFTLIELLTVIAIIAILMSLLFPAVNAVKDAAKKADAKNTCAGIVAAVKQYHAEYGKYPPITVEGGGTEGEEPKDVIIGDKDCKNAKATNNVLFNILRALNEEPNKDHKLNPRKIQFLEGKSVADATSPRGGFLEKGRGEEDLQGCYFDPWGKQYNIIIDTTADSKIDIDEVYSDADWRADGRPHVGVGAFSMGKNTVVGGNKKEGLEGKYRDGQKVSDDVISWQ